MAYPDALSGQDDSWFDAASPREVFVTLKHDFARDFFRRVAVQILAVMALIEAIFLAERFTIVFDAALQKNANLVDISFVLACTSTEIFDLALAIAVLTAVYWICLQMREERELLVLSAAGIGIFQIIVLVMAVALAAQFASLAVSGFIDPISRYAERLILFDAEYRALRNGVTTGQFYYFPHHVAFAPPKPHGPDRRPFEPGEYYFSPNYVAPRKGPRSADERLFVYERTGPGVARIVTADHAYLDGPDTQGRLFLRVRDFGSHTLLEAQSVIDASGPQKLHCKFQGLRCPDKFSDLPQLSMHVRNLSQEMSIDELIPFPPRGVDAVEQTLVDELFFDGSHPGAKRMEEMSLLGQRFARGLLCLLAPLMALGAVSLTTRFTNNFTLPLACMALMTLDLATERLIRAIAPTGPASAIAIPLAVAIGLTGVLVWLIRRVQGAVVRPQLSRP
jgi:lipopolysaccharide export system permease protein